MRDIKVGDTVYYIGGNIKHRGVPFKVKELYYFWMSDPSNAECDVMAPDGKVWNVLAKYLVDKEGYLKYELDKTLRESK